MGDIHYMISEAAKDVGVESHVLRYWEEELNIVIDRTEMGHRYYTEDDIQLFQCIRKLKDEGVLLKELKVLAPELQKAKKFKKVESLQEISRRKERREEQQVEQQVKQRAAVNKQTESKGDTNRKNFEKLLEDTLKKNNVRLEQGICDLVTDSIKREMTYLLDAKEQLEEDRYRRLDTVIRQQQALRKESGKKYMPVLMKQVLGV